MRVVSKAVIVSGAKRGSNVFSNHARPCVPINQARRTVPAVNGITMNTTTEYNKTLNGTVSDDAPVTRNWTIGTNATSMMRSFTDTCTSVYAGSPSVRWLQTNTMAVHGAAARMIHPAMYWSASAGPMNARNMTRKNNQASSAIENGFMSQFTTSVTTS